MMTETAKRLRQMSIRTSIAFPGKSGRSNYSDEWYTPPRIVAALGPFDLDPCAGPMAHAARNLRREDDGLAQPWAGRVWMNPPYSNVHEWLEKFISHADGVALVNARPETQWFQRLCADAAAVLWLRGRIQFDMPSGPSKHPTVGSVLVAYGERNASALLASGLPGVVMTVRHCTPNIPICVKTHSGKAPTEKQGISVVETNE
jgi:phage N-6-adenine-methyltransferase